MSQEIDEDQGNLAALQKLRSLPRGSQVESRVAAIQHLLTDHEIFKTIQSLRWPRGVICPRCQSHNVVVRTAPASALDKRKHYECLDCRSQGNPSEFDDLTGLPMGDRFMN
jgi:hypothetical protein